jgi:putative membrane protein
MRLLFLMGNMRFALPSSILLLLRDSLLLEREPHLRLPLNHTGDDTMSALADPRVFFAAERTLLAWTRTSLTLMAFGFVVERFGLFIQMLLPQHSETLQRGLSFWIGLSFIILGALASIAAVVQYRRVLRTLKPEEIPVSYLTHLGSWANLIVAILGVALSAYLFRGSLL